MNMVIWWSLDLAIYFFINLLVESGSNTMTCRPTWKCLSVAFLLYRSTYLCCSAVAWVSAKSWISLRLDCYSDKYSETDFPTVCKIWISPVHDLLSNLRGLVSVLPIIVKHGLTHKVSFLDSQIHHKTISSNLCHCFGRSLQTWYNNFLILCWLLSITEFPSGCRGVDQRGHHPNNFLNCWVRSAVKKVAWSDVMTVLTLTRGNTCNRQSHTASAVGECSGNAYGNLVWESTRHRQ